MKSYESFFILIDFNEKDKTKNPINITFTGFFLLHVVPPGLEPGTT